MSWKRKIFLCVLPIIALALVTKKKETVSLKLVTDVELVCQEGDHIICRHYTKPHKVQQVLNYLRLQKNLGQAEIDPERVRGTVIQIDICLSNGARHVYYQRAGQYLSRQYRPWQKINPVQAEAFTQLIRVTPSDM